MDFKFKIHSVDWHVKVRCIRDRVAELPDFNIRAWLNPRYLSIDNDHPIIFDKGREYIVYGINFWDNHPFYFLCDEEDNEYPVPFYSGFFEVIDDRLSKFWRLAYRWNEKGIAITSLIHKDWVADPMFYENLIDGGENEVKLFQKQKKEMDDEASI